MDIFNYLLNLSALIPIIAAIGITIYVLIDEKEENRNRGKLKLVAQKAMKTFSDAELPDSTSFSSTTYVPSKDTSKIDINTASADEISKLLGLNLILAKKLVEHRTNVKRFSNVDEVVDLLDLKPHIRKQLLECIQFGQELSGHDVRTKNNDSTKGRVVDF